MLGTVKSIPVAKSLGGDFSYFGIENSLGSSGFLNPQCRQLKIMVNIDGIPLSKSASSAFWPIFDVGEWIQSANSGFVLWR